MNQQKTISDYLSSVAESQVDESYVRSLEERIRRLERIVYAENITDLKSLIMVKREEFANTLARLSNTSEITNYIHSDRNTYLNKAKEFNKLMLDLDFSLEKDRKFYIDTTQLLLTPYTTGIQRVAQQLISSGRRQGLIPIFHHGNEIFSFEFSERKIIPCRLGKGDWLLMPNASWMEDNTKSFMNFVFKQDVRIASIIYDLIPLEYPNAFPPETASRFKIWYNDTAVYSDLLICISKTVQTNATEQIKLIQPQITHRPRIEYAYLGNDFSQKIKNNKTNFVHSFIADKIPFFLSVGTLEPRKGYKIVLDAMEALWEQGHNARYVIVGRYGWLSRNLEHRIISHPELNKRLFWWQDVPDIDLQELYKSAKALICASVAEGFGLPIIEAAIFGLPSICSDIDVFKEVTGKTATFFEVANSNKLSKALVENLNVAKTPPPNYGVSWDTATNNIIALMQ